MTTPKDVDRVAWLALVAGENREHGGNDGYDDEPAEHYSWDSSVPNHARVKVGDAIVLWEERGLIGASVIESIETAEVDKWVHRCPDCHKAGIKRRRKQPRRYRCYKCKAEFDEPRSEQKRVTAYRSKHDRGWVDLAGCLSAGQLRPLAYLPDSQNSFRQLRWGNFVDAVHASGLDVSLRVLDAAGEQIAGGHARAVVRARRGQGAFRRALLDQFGSVCAFTGKAPVDALEAAHLYSYATTGRHDSRGGFLLRRDLHRLFDLGHIAVHPTDAILDIAPALFAFPDYASLHGKSLAVPLTVGHRRWLQEHWAEHRTSIPRPLPAV
ncbi:HNH endonuclease [Micromonospora marina]|uniref:HNH endonuclease n=1 Tax=Micromonospora marina TaxID=307120 RepID=UPI003D72EE0C